MAPNVVPIDPSKLYFILVAFKTTVVLLTLVLIDGEQKTCELLQQSVLKLRVTLYWCPFYGGSDWDKLFFIFAGLQNYGTTSNASLVVNREQANYLLQ